MQSTGQTSTQDASLTPMQGWVITYAKVGTVYGKPGTGSGAERGDPEMVRSLAAAAKEEREESSQLMIGRIDPQTRMREPWLGEMPQLVSQETHENGSEAWPAPTPDGA